MLTVVTACDEKYAPGAVALYNSINRNTKEGEIDFYCMAFGSEEFCNSLPMKTIKNPRYPDGQNFPKGGRWSANVMPGYPEGMNPSQYAMPAMYARLLIADLFESLDRVLWIDADCLVIDSLKELESFDFSGHCMASTDITEQLNGNFKSLREQHGQGNCLGIRAPGTGVMMINIEAWRSSKISEKCFQLMNDAVEGEWLAVVQNAIILAVNGDFAEFGWEYMRDVKRHDPPPGTKIIHFPIVIPWDSSDVKRKPPEMQANIKRHWEPYR